MKRIIILFLFLFSFLGFGQNSYDVYCYNTENKIETSNITDIVVGNHKCYVATHNKIYEFDGLNFIEIPYKAQFGADRNTIRKICIYRNSLIILFEKGCSKVDLLSGQSQILTEDLVLDIFSDNSFFVLLKEKYIVEEYNEFAGKRVFSLSRFWKKVNINSKIGIFENRFFISIPHRSILMYDNGKIKELKNIIPGGYKESFKLQDNKILFLGSKDIHYFNEKTKAFENLKISKVENYFRILDKVDFHKSTYFIFNDKFLYASSDKLDHKIDLSIDNNIELRKILVFKNSLLLSSNKGLFVVYKKNNFITHLTNELSDPMKFRTRRKILQLNDKIILFGNPAPVIVSKRKVIKNDYVQKDLAVYDAVKSPKGFYVGTEGKGIFFTDYSLQTFKKIALNKYGNNSNMCALYYDNNSRSVFSGDDMYLYRFSDEDNPKIDYFDVPYKGYMSKIIIKDTVTSSFYVGSTNGLYKFRNSKFSKSIPTHGKEVGDIYIDYQSARLWVGHDKGIDILDISTNRLIKFIPLNFIADPKVASIIKDNFNLFWISTFSGIVCLDSSGKKIAFLSKKNGLINTEFNFKAALKSQNEIIFGGIDGYDFIDSKLFNKHVNRPKGFFSAVSFMGKDTLSLKRFKEGEALKVDFNKDDYFARIFFSTDANSPENAIFYYRINNTDWKRISPNHYFDIMGYETGSYKFELRGTDVSGQDINFKPLLVDIHQNFYKSYWFLVIVAIIISALFILVFWMKISKKYEIDNLLKEISMDLHDEVGSLVSKSSFLVKQDKSINIDSKELLISNFDKVLSSLKMYININDSKSMSISNLADDVTNVFLDYFFLREISFIHKNKIRGHDTASIRLIKDIKLCCLELANNISKYSNASSIEMEFQYQNNFIQITLLTNEKHNLLKIRNGGSGLRNISTRASRHNGTFRIINFNSYIKFEIFFAVKK